MNRRLFSKVLASMLTRSDGTVTAASPRLHIVQVAPDPAAVHRWLDSTPPDAVLGQLEARGDGLLNLGPSFEQLHQLLSGNSIIQTFDKYTRDTRGPKSVFMQNARQRTFWELTAQDLQTHSVQGPLSSYGAITATGLSVHHGGPMPSRAHPSDGGSSEPNDVRDHASRTQLLVWVREQMKARLAAGFTTANPPSRKRKVSLSNNGQLDGTAVASLSTAQLEEELAARSLPTLGQDHGHGDMLVELYLSVIGLSRSERDVGGASLVSPLDFLAYGGVRVGYSLFPFGPARLLSSNDVERFCLAVSGLTDDSLRTAELQKKIDQMGITCAAGTPPSPSSASVPHTTSASVDYLIRKFHLLQEFLKQAVQQRAGLLLYHVN